MAEQAGYVGQRLGNYVLVRLLGQGGFAEVYLGEHIHLKTQAAVKLLHTRLAHDDIDGFRREAQTIARLVHPHIVRVLDFGVEGGAPYLAMDYAPYGTLRNRHPKGARVPLPSIVQYVRQAAEALDFAHAQRLIHRDVKPENMLVGRNGEILLSDFGIALASQSSVYQHTQDVAGTIAYMAPEQIQAHPRPASDQYALGIVIYEWLSGNRPFQGTYTEVAIKHTMTPPPPLRGQMPELPPAVEEVVMRALHKDPRQRFDDVRTLAAALEQASLNRSQFSAPGQASTRGAAPTQSHLSSYPTSIPASPYAPFQPMPGQAPNTAYPNGSAPGAPLNNALPPGQQFSHYPPHPSAPYGGMPGSQPPMPYVIAVPQAQPKRGISRRAVIGGLLLAVAGSGATWYLLSHYGTALQSVSKTLPGGGGLLPGATPSATPQIAYKGHSDFIWSVAWSPDGKYIASSSQDGTAQ
ncbi:MAG TPA: protein kinase, partial [Chthonomonadales bacterium]|nr:protein kinase [Chthonomonadales bacterium]